MKRYLSELTREELEKVLKANSVIGEEITDYIVNGLFDNFRMNVSVFYNKSIKDYEFNSVYRSYMTIRDASTFVKELSEEYNEFQYYITEESAKLLERLEKRADFYDMCKSGYEDISESRFENLEKWFEEGAKKIAQEIMDSYDAEIESAYDPDTQIEYIDIFMENNPDIYVLDESYTAYEDIVKCYA